jgi:asparagine synthase (glutamine-hydrolysing)
MQTRTAAGPGAPAVTVHGYCGLSPAQIASAIESGGAGSLVDASGHFVIVYRAPDGDVIVSSRSGVVGYFVTAHPDGGRRAHGPDVATVVRNAGLRPGWDHEAVADYLMVGHPLGAATPHPEVARLAGSTVIRIPDRGARQQSPVPEPAQHYPGSPSSPEGAVDALLDAVEQDVPRDCALSMSGGLDSRLLLAASLALGRRPRLIISGIPGSFDREVATSLGRRLGLPVSLTEVTADDVVRTLPSIARVTNGLIPADNWAGIAHLRSAPPGEVPVMLGFNGEIARLYYAPRTGLGVLLAARSVPRGDRAVLLGHRFGSPFTPEDQRWLAPELRAAMEPAAITGRLLKAVRATAPDSAFALADRLFLENYGWQKLGSDLAAIGLSARWRAPMFASTFTHCVRSLPLRWKVGDRLHRYAIARLYRPLLDAPEEGYGPRTATHVPARYWLRGPRPSRSPFFLDSAIFQDPGLLDLMIQHRDGLADLIDPQLLDHLVAEQLAAPRRSHAVFRLLGLALWAAASRDR